METIDGTLSNSEAVLKIRDAWISAQLSLRSSEFTSLTPLKVHTCTWNVNAKKITSTDPTYLDPWLFPPQSQSQSQPASDNSTPDIVAVAFQEIVDLNAVNVALDSKAMQKSVAWQEDLLASLNQRDSYSFVCEKHLVGMLLCVYVKTKHTSNVKYVYSDSVGVGVMGMLGNKGGVSVRLQIYDSTFCFTCSHFAAHRENVSGRNADYGNILSKLKFEIGREAVEECIKSGSLSQWHGGSGIGILDHDFVFWMGDFNYRIDETLSTDEVFERASNRDLTALKMHDQLNIERGNGNVFQGFSEGEIDFLPTYKYQTNTDLYECRPDKKLRAPAWCDRVLFCSQKPEHTKQICYLRSELNISDHKPVMATFTTQIKQIVSSKRSEVYVEVMRTLDKFENQSLPKVDLDKIGIDFKEVFYETKASESILLTNTGSVVAHFRLVPKLEEVALCKPWISVNPSFGMLIPGESAKINFTVNVDNATATKLNMGKDIFEDILILRLENGRDYYLTVNGTYARSCYGMSVTDLVLIDQPVRAAAVIPLDSNPNNNNNNNNSKKPLSVPKELWRIIDAIYEKGLHEKDLFMTPGFGNEVTQIREALDSGTDFPFFHVHSMCETMLSFLSSLSSPIVPMSLFPTIEIDAQNIQPWSRRFLEDLPPIHYNVFVYIISFFREVLLFSESNGINPQRLARVCCNCMVREGGGGNRERKLGMMMIFTHFLTTTNI